MISDEIIERFLLGEYSLEELELLKAYFQQEDVQELAQLIQATWNKDQGEEIPPEKVHLQWKEFKAHISPLPRKKSAKTLRLKIVGYGSLIAASLLLGIFILKPDPLDLNKVVNEKIPLLMEDQMVTIKLDDGSVKNILPTATRPILTTNGFAVAQQKQNKLVYSVRNTTITEQRFNTLTVPLGKTFKVVLSDLSEITLNAGSSLRYPVQFADDKSREVYLSGEGYFSIEKAKTPFVVHTTNLSTTVYGTQFNISSYPNESTTKVVLVEGSIGVHELNQTDTSVLLKPNEMAAYDKSLKNIAVTEVDVSSYISWIDGVLLFKNANFEEIIRKLERHFNEKIQVTEAPPQHQKFTGRFEIESIEEILKTIQKVVDFNYKINSKIYSTNF